MKLIEITFSFDEGWQKKCERNGITKTTKALVNIAHIVSISEWEGTLLHEGRRGTKVVTINNDKFVDDRHYDEFVECLNNL